MNKKYAAIAMALIFTLIALTACALSPQSQLQICVLSSCSEAEGENIEQVDSNDTGSALKP